MMKVVQKGVSAVPCSADPANVMMGSGGFAGGLCFSYILMRAANQAAHLSLTHSFFLPFSLYILFSLSAFIFIFCSLLISRKFCARCWLPE